MIQSKTARGASDVLTIAQNHLRGAGRPRKPLGRPRPARQHEKMSLLGAINYAAKILGATRTQKQAAIEYLADEVYCAVNLTRPWAHNNAELVQAFDDQTFDTRLVIRAIQRTKRELLAEQ